MSEIPKKLNVLFVDDEVDILAGLRLTLRKERKRWNMLFAHSSEEALEILASEPVDIICSDLQMPGMNGSELLSQVRMRYEGVGRIVVSGHADDQIALDAISVSHRFLIKPASREAIVAAIDGVHSALATIESHELRDLVASVGCMPAHRPFSEALTKLLDDEASTPAALGEVIARDPAMSAKLLQIANSSYFSGTENIVSIAAAASTFGATTASGIISQTRSSFSAQSDAQFAAIQRRSVLTSAIAKHIATDMQLDVEAAATSGLLAELGNWLLEVAAPEIATEAQTLARDEERPLHEAQESVMGVNHSALGAALLGTWGLPASVVESVQLQHTTRPRDCSELDLAGVLHIARYLAQQCMDQIATDPDSPPQPLDFGYVNATGIADKVREWGDHCRDQAEQILTESDSKAA